MKINKKKQRMTCSKSSDSSLSGGLGEDILKVLNGTKKKSS